MLDIIPFHQRPHRHHLPLQLRLWSIRQHTLTIQAYSSFHLIIKYACALGLFAYTHARTLPATSFRSYQYAYQYTPPLRDVHTIDCASATFWLFRIQHHYSTKAGYFSSGLWMTPFLIHLVPRRHYNADATISSPSTPTSMPLLAAFIFVS
jgi:hypothetical protein